MHIKYEILTNILFRHKYFSHQRLECLSVQPSKSTEQLLLNNGLVFKSFKDGFALFYESFSNGDAQTKQSLQMRNITLRFYVTLSESSFFNYTEIGKMDISTTFYHFHNMFERKDSFAPNLLHQEEFVSEADSISEEEHGEQYFRKPFALVDININNEILDEYVISFKEKQTYWRYILMSEHLKELHQPAILGEQAIFNGPIKKVLPNKSEVLSFESNKPISLNQVPLKHFKLVENYENESSLYKTVIRLLPTPNTNSISSIKDITDSKPTEYSEIFIY